MAGVGLAVVLLTRGKEVSFRQACVGVVSTEGLARVMVQRGWPVKGFAIPSVFDNLVQRYRVTRRPTTGPNASPWLFRERPFLLSPLLPLPTAPVNSGDSPVGGDAKGTAAGAGLQQALNIGRSALLYSRPHSLGSPWF